jgi:hypothetical protein
MAEPDPIAVAFDALRQSVPTVAPGVGAARRTVERRRRRRYGVVGAGVLLAAVMGVVGTVRTPDAPVGVPVETPPATGTVTPSPSPEPSQSASGVGPAASTGRSAGGNPGTPCRSGYPKILREDPRTGGSVDLVVGYETLTALCPGSQMRVFWASYLVDGAGDRHLYRSQSYSLDRSRPQVTMRVVLPPPNCAPNWYVVFGDVPVLATIPASTPVGNPNNPYTGWVLRGQFQNVPCASPSPGG